MTELRIIPIPGVPEVAEGDDLGALLVKAAGEGGLEDRDILVVAHKVVSKAEGRVVAATDRRTAAVKEAARVLRRSNGMIIAETHHGFVCANAGIDASNVPGDNIVLLPLDPDLSARGLRARIAALIAIDVGVVISDTFGRAWRLGQTNVAIGVAGFDPFMDYRGGRDAHGKDLSATRICAADEIAGAAELVMGKSSGICAAIVRGATVLFGHGNARSVLRPAREDLFR